MNSWQCVPVFRDLRTLSLGVLLLATSAVAQTVQQTTSIADTSSGTPKPLAMAVNPTTDAVYAINADGSILYIDGSQSIPVANPTTACAAAALDSLGTTALAAYTPLNEAFFYANGNLDAVTGAVGSCSSGSVPVLTSTTLAGEHSPLVATDSGLGYIYAVNANLSSSTGDTLVIVNAHTGAIVGTPTLGGNATYSSMVVDPVTHLVFVSDTTTSVIYVVDPAVTPITVTVIAGYAGTLFVQPLVSPFSGSQLVVAGSTVVNLFSIAAIQSAQSSAVPSFSGTYNKLGLGSAGSGTVIGLALKSPLLDTVNGVLYGALSGQFDGDLPAQTLYSVALSTLPSGANSTTAVGAEVGGLDIFDPGLSSAPTVPYALALVPNPSATTHPRIYAVQTDGVSILLTSDANTTGIQLFDTSLATPITATKVPLPLTCPSTGVPLGSTCALLPSGIVADPTNNNVYVSGNLAYGTSFLTSVADYYVNVVQAPVNLLCATPSTTTPVAGAPTSLTVYLCSSTGTPITSPAYAGTVHFSSTDTKAILPANYTFQASDAGSHTFTGVVLETSGSQTISYADTVTSTTKGSTAYTVSAAGAATMVPSAGTPQFALTGTAFGTQLAASVTDAYGNGVPGVVVSFTAPSTGASGTFAGSALVQTGSNGVATAPAFTANSTAGAFSVTASAAGVSPVSFSLTNEAPLPVAVLIPGIISTLHTDAGTTGSIPAASAFDSAGNFYVLDSGLNKITEYPVGGGAAVTIVPKTGQSVTLNTPSDMIIEPSGTSLLVSDYANNRLVRVSLGTTVTTTALTLTGVPPVSTTCSNPISGTSLCLPTGIAEDYSENIYVSDTSNGRVLKLTNSGAYLSTVLAAGSSALMAPLGLAVDPSGNVFVANTTGTSSAGNILKVSPAAAVTTISGGAIVAPFGLATDQAGDVYFTDSSTLESSVITPASVVIPFAGDGAKTDSGDNGPASLAGIAGPLGFTLDAKANAYIADSVQSAANGGAIREVNASQSALAFGSVTQGVPSTPQSLALLNAGAATLSIASATVTGPNAADFVLTNHCASTLSAGQTCALSVVFTPSTSAAESATVTVTDNSGGSAGATQTIALSGTGTALPVEGPPTFSPVTGSTVAPGSTVVLSAPFGTNPTGYATIYYTTNGTTPTTSSSSCVASSCSVTLSSTSGATETIEAFAALPGYTTSTVATATYTIATLPVEGPPTFSPVTGSTVAPGSTVVLSAPFGTNPTGYATIYYTTNGTTPTTSSSSCIASSCSVTLSSTSGVTETIEAFAVLSGYQNSAVASASYTVTLTTPPAPTPYFNPAGGTASTGEPVTIFDNASNGTIYYTTNGTTPTTSSASCSVICNITLTTVVPATETIQAIATGPGYSTSAVGSTTFTILPYAPTPTFSPAGGTVAAGSTVTISETLAGAAIYYTTNNTTPTTSSASCVSPCSVMLSSTIGTAETIQAVAGATGYLTSSIASASYTTNPTFTFLATATNPSVTIAGTPTGTVVGSSTTTTAAPDDVTVTLTLTSLNGYNSPITVSIIEGAAPSDFAAPTAECVTSTGIVLSTSVVAGAITCVPSAPYVPAAGGTKVYVTFTYGAVPTPMLSKPPASKEQSRAASAGLAVSLVALLMGTFAGRRRLLANAVKFMAMVCLIVSLGVLVGACGTSGNENFLGDNSGTISPSTTVVQSTITATPPSGTPQSVTIYNTYTNGSI